MVSVMKGLNVQKSRFAALSLEQDSEEEEEEKTQWQQVSAHNKSKAPQKKDPSHGAQGEEPKGLSKNAKKRARKKRNKSTSSDHEGGSGKVKEDSAELAQQYEEVWRLKNEQAMEEEFEKDLREALMQSTLEAKQQKVLQEMREAEERAMAASAATTKPTAKKAVKLTLQELHSMASSDQLAAPAAQPTSQPLRTPTEYPLSPDGFSCSPMDMDTKFHFLEDVEAELSKEMDRDSKQVQEKVYSEEEMGMIPRIAHLKDELEKRDKVIGRLKKDNATLKKSLNEVKERNQSLCSIMSQGEFSKKAELLKQVEELSSVKNDLTLEVANLSSLLEQERSKNKALRIELNKLQNSHAKTSKN